MVLALALMVLGAGALPEAGHAAMTPIQDLQRALQRLDRQLCAKWPGPKCRQGSSRTKTRPVAKAAPSGESDIPLVVIPKLKPVRTEQGTDGLILPKLKPTAIAATDATSDEPTTVKLPASPDEPVAEKTDRVMPSPPRKEAAVIKPKLLQSRPPIADPGPLKNPMPEGTLAGEACLQALQILRVDFAQAATPVSTGACSVHEPVRLTSMKAGGALVKFPDKPLLTCGFAARFAAWVANEGVPAVRSAKGASLLAVGTGPGFQCRGRNGDASGKLSEHAFGNAVDIEYLKLSDGDTVQVQGSTFGLSSDARLLKDLRSSGCRYFTTVLGPGTNAAHARHFHFDLERRGKKGNHKLCE